MYWPAYPYPDVGMGSSVAAGMAANASGQAVRAQSRVDELESSLQRLALVSEALWTLLRDRVGITEKDLLERIQQVDLTDGVLDGRVRRPPMNCPSCQRVVSLKNRRCLYCLAELKPPPFAV